MTYTIEQLEKMLADATPGPWELCILNTEDAKGEEYESGLGVSAQSGAFIHGHDLGYRDDTDDEIKANAALIASAPTLATAHMAALKRVAELEADNERLIDGIAAIRQYGWDTLTGPTVNADDTRDWQRAAVNEMTKRAVRLANGETWEAPAGDAT